jgi:hypothetical protein
MGMPTKKGQIPSRTTEAGKALNRATRAEVLARLQAQPVRTLQRSAAEIIRAERGA